MTDLAQYYDESIPPSLLVPPAPPATGATAGIPGSWTPAGSAVPASVAELQAANPPIAANPNTLWTVGQYVQTGTTGVAGRAHWSGSAWVAGAAPVVGADPQSSTIAQVQAYIEAYAAEHGGESDPAVIAETQRVLDAERAGAARTTLIAWLDARDGVT